MRDYKTTAIFFFLLLLFPVFLNNPLAFAEDVVDPGTLVSQTSVPGPEITSVDSPSNPPVKQPISIDADTVEYSADNKDVTATGNVLVIYKDTTLRCQKITVNTQTKSGLAEGGVRLEDPKGLIEADKMEYNFQTRQGVMYDAAFRANPFFGRAEKVVKVDDVEFIGMHAQMSTCNFDKPHWRMKTRKVDFFRGDKVKIKDVRVSLGQDTQAPILYLPQYNRSLQDPMAHVSVMPGKSKAWGPYMLTAWRYKITDNVGGNVYFDYRSSLGLAEGFNTNYISQNFGKGDFKFYYTQERDKSKDLSPDVNVPKVFERYFVRARHKWDIGPNTTFMGEFYHIKDSKMMIHGTDFNFLKDYFKQEYDKDSRPLSYAQLHHLFSSSSLDVLVQKRTNSWYTQMEMLPEIKYTLPSSQVLESPFYFENLSSYANYNQRNVSTLTPLTNNLTPDVNMTRFDTFNKISLPRKVSIFQFTPFVGERLTYYNSGRDGSSLSMRTIFYSGADLSTKFYKILNVKNNFLGLDINGLRHIITPTVAYTYNRTPSISYQKIKQIDAIDALDTNNAATFELSNKLQTKRNNVTVDLANFRVTNSYTFRSAANKGGGTLSDFLLYLDVLPYSWMSLRSDATFGRQEHTFTEVNADLNVSFGPGRTVGVGHRYVRRGSKEMTFEANWRLNPKWSFRVYERYQFGNAVNLSKGIRQQQFTVSRDLHCWTTDVTLDLDKVNGDSLWVVFRCKAFPELQFDFNQNYRQPTPGSQNTGG